MVFQVKFTPPPVPRAPLAVLDHLPSSSLLSPPRRGILETRDQILTPPATRPPHPRPTKNKQTVNTKYAMMLTQPTVIDILKQKQLEKEQKEQQKAENKRKKEEKKKEKQQQATTNKKKKPKVPCRLIPKRANKENIHPNTSPVDFDPYQH